MIIGLKYYLGLALSFGIVTFWNLLLSKISGIYIKISSKSEAHNAYKLVRCIVSFTFYFCDTL